MSGKIRLPRCIGQRDGRIFLGSADKMRLLEFDRRAAAFIHGFSIELRLPVGKVRLVQGQVDAVAVVVADLDANLVGLSEERQQLGRDVEEEFVRVLQRGLEAVFPEVVAWRLSS